MPTMTRRQMHETCDVPRCTKAASLRHRLKLGYQAPDGRQVEVMACGDDHLERLRRKLGKHLWRE